MAKRPKFLRFPTTQRRAYNAPVQLRAGIRILPTRTLEGSIELSSGTIPFSKSGCRNLEYQAHAILPAGTWRAPTEQEKQLLVGWPALDRPGFWLALFRAPAEVLSPFEPARSAIKNVACMEDLAREWGRNTPATAMSEFGRLALMRFGCDSDQQAGLDFKGGVRFNEPGLATVTVHPETKRLVGLHIDDSISQGLEPHLAPTRISINLGTGDRFLLFVNIPIMEIARIVDNVDEQLGRSHLARRFLLENPEYPVIRVRIPPGGGYIAPTEIMIHDAATTNMLRPDVVLLLQSKMPLLPP